MAESEEELKRLLMKGKEKSEKFGLKLNIQKTKIMASGPMTSWEIDGNNPWFNRAATHPYNVYHDMNHENAMVKEHVKKSLEIGRASCRERVYDSV